MRWIAGVGALLVGLWPGVGMGQVVQGNPEVVARSVGAPPPTSVDPWELPPLELQRVAGPITLDGTPDEAAWAALDPLPLVQHWPVFMAEMSARTVIRVGYDEEYLYAAGWFYGDPGEIRANSLRRDRWDGDDSFDLVVDSYNDDQTALKFTTMPSGAQMDFAISNDAQPGGSQPPMNEDWNTFWDAATSRTEEGWFAEVRVPLSSLGFEAVDGRAVMGIIVGRYMAGANETHLFPAIPPRWDLSDAKPSRARNVALQGVEEQRPLWVTPYLLGGVQRVRQPDAVPVVAPGADWSREMGLDVKYGLSSNLTLDLTLNTDFAQVESDALEVNLDRFSLFLPEKRQFFQERASTFEFDMGEGRLFHSRTIGISEDGELRRILGGARVGGRVGDWDVGALSMQVQGDPAGPWENDAVVRVRRSLSSAAYAGLMVTSRTLGSGGTDLSLGADGRVALGRDLVTVQAAHTTNGTAGDAAGGSLRERSALRVFGERQNRQGWGYDWSFLYSGDEYDPALGFEGRNDFTAVTGRLQYSWSPGENSPLARATAIAAGRLFTRNHDRSLESSLLRARFMADFKSGHWFNLALNYFQEDVAEAFTLPGADVPAGRHPGADVFAYFRTSRAKTVGADARVYTGSAFDGWRTSVMMEPWWRLSRHLTVAGSLDIHRISFPDRTQTVNADRATLRVSAALDTRLSAEALVQYSAASRTVGTNVRIRYRFAEGRDLYLVVDEGRDLDDLVGVDGRLLGSRDRRVMVKYSWAFRG